MKYAWMFALLCIAAAADDTLRTETFDEDPGWDGHNNVAEYIEPRQVVQNFGWEDGRIGGTVSPDGYAAFYAMRIPPTTFDAPLSASGTMYVKKGPGHTLIGFFNNGTVNEWRTPNAIVFRINGRGDTFHTHFEYTTDRWRAGAGVIGTLDTVKDRVYPIDLPGDRSYEWTLTYNPTDESGNGVISATFGEYAAQCIVTAEHRADGLTMNHFGILNTNKSVDSPGDLWLSNLTVMDKKIDLAIDPRWDAQRNRGTYISTEIRPRFDFGYRRSGFARGAQRGEIGGTHYRGDCRYPDRMACYGAETESLTLDKPLHASGTIALTRGVTDSTVLFGFYHAERSMESSDSQENSIPKDFFGIAIEGPSSEGFFVYPTWRTDDGESAGGGYDPRPPGILPDGTSHHWSLDYTPPSEGKDGSVTVTLDEESVTKPVPAAAVNTGTQFNRLGFITTWIDGNAQRLYIDDLTYTCRQ